MTDERDALELYQPSQTDLVIHRPPAKVLQEAKEAADALIDVVKNKKRPVVFNGEQYLEFEDLQTLARFYDITAKVRHTSFVQYDKVSGFEASAEAILVATGQVISSADAMCLNDEPNWSKKPMFQLRSMAQTRACAKSLRNVLAWVVVLAGYRPTPAEEMDSLIHDKRKPKPQPDLGPTSQPEDEYPEPIMPEVDREAFEQAEQSSYHAPDKCGKCGAELVYHEEGKWGPWWSCSKWRETNCDFKVSKKKWDKETNQ